MKLNVLLKLVSLGVAVVALAPCSIAPVTYTPIGDALACVTGEPCSSNPGSDCLLGTTSCTTGVEVCVDAQPKPDGTSCDGTSTCALGNCLPATTVSTSVNLTQAPLTMGRTCGEAPAFAVTSLTLMTATVATAPQGDCLTAGDEVMLINLQGTPTGTTNVGNWELLRVANLSGETITFTTPKTRSYGSSLDENIGSAGGQQKVALIRVPRFGTFTVQANATITASRWNGMIGGVIAIRAGAFVIDGTITAARLGYRNGRWSRDSACLANLLTETGESISGPSRLSTAPSIGGSGGISEAFNISFSNNTPMCSTAGHAEPGQLGLNANGRTLGGPGVAYGVPNGTRLTMGSGSAGNMTCVVGGAPLAYVDIAADTPGGGIIVLVGGDMVLGASSSVTATAQRSIRDVAAAGGYIFLRGRDLSLGTLQVTALGARADNGNGPTGGPFRDASPGYIAIEATGMVTGSTNPAALLVP